MAVQCLSCGIQLAAAVSACVKPLLLLLLDISAAVASAAAVAGAAVQVVRHQQLQQLHPRNSKAVVITCHKVVHYTPEPEAWAHICLALAHKLKRQCVLPPCEGTLQGITNSALGARNLQQTV
jgi:hypothetical protein